MGREAVSLVVSMTVSRHNDDRDVRDDRLVEELGDEIADLCRQEKYAPIKPEVW